MAVGNSKELILLLASLISQLKQGVMQPSLLFKYPRN